MPDQVITPDRTVEEYKSGVKPTWCPGCGDFGVLNAVYNSLRTQGYAPQDVVLVSGIGCSSRLPFFSSTYGFHTVHGRTMPIATGIKVANPNLKVLAQWHLSDAQLSLAGEHPDFGPVTLRQLLATWVAHDLNHLGQMARVMARQYRDAVGPWRAYLPIMDR